MPAGQTAGRKRRRLLNEMSVAAEYGIALQKLTVFRLNELTWRIAGRCGVCCAQVTGRLNLAVAIRVMLTTARAKFEHVKWAVRRGGLYGTTGSKMPRQSPAQAFGLWRSGKFTNGTPGAALAGRISEARSQLAVPAAHLLCAYLRSRN